MPLGYPLFELIAKSGRPLTIHIMKNKTDVQVFASDDAQSKKKDFLL